MMSFEEEGAQVWEHWAKSYNHRGYLGTLGEVEGTSVISSFLWGFM